MIKEFKPENLKDVLDPKKRMERKLPSLETIENGKNAYSKYKNELILAAILKHVNSISYRGFKVGSSLLAYNSSVEGGYFIEASHNLKPIQHTQSSWDKLCAENSASTTAILDGADYIAGLVVVSHHKSIGTEVEDKMLNQHALHSCQNCRNLFREMLAKGLMSDQTMINFVDDGKLIYEDKNDTEPFVIPSDEEEGPIQVEHPKLKLIKPINLEDVNDLPFEEMTMGDFLLLYNQDPPSKPGNNPPPYTLV